ncbi:MAG: hypothetical protein RLZZ127_310 [Planctomycetota bacterium]|jgi:hypothetical protein
MQFDISRDFLDGILLQHPPAREGAPEIRAAGQLHFLPSSPDGTMHTAIVSFALFLGKEEKEGEQPFARGGWRFLFTTDKPFNPTKDSENQFFGTLLMLGTGKIMATINNLSMLANLPLIPFEPQRMALQKAPAAPAQQQAAQQ